MSAKPESTRKRSGQSDSSSPKLDGRVLSARPDTLDFRDLMDVPTLVEVPGAVQGRH